MSALLREALKTAKLANEPALDADPIDTPRPGSRSNLFTGTASDQIGKQGDRAPNQFAETLTILRSQGMRKARQLTQET